MATAFDQRRTVFDEAPRRTAFDSGRTAFDEPEIIDVTPIGRANVRRQMDEEMRRLRGEGQKAERLMDVGLMSPINYAGNVARGAVADIAAGLLPLNEATKIGGNKLFDTEEFKKAAAFAPSQSGNILAALADEPLPIDTTLSDIAAEAPVAATIGKISQGVAGSAPLIAIMPQGALGKLVAAGFTADMLRHAGPDATALGEEMGKPPEERDYDRITTSLSSLAQTAAFAPAAGAHAGGSALRAGGRAALERVAPTRAAINELARALQQEPAIAAPTSRPGLRQLGVRIPEGEFAQPGVRELADKALREAQGYNILAEFQEPALLRLRREINPPRMVESGLTPAERIFEGGGEAPFGKVSYRRPAEDVMPGRTQANPPMTEAESTGLRDFITEEVSAGRKVPDSLRERFGPAPSQPRRTPQARDRAKTKEEEAIQRGMEAESGFYLDEPRTQTLPEPAPPKPREGTTIMNPQTGRVIVKPTVLSNLQKQRLRKAFERGADEEVLLNIIRSPEREGGPMRPQEGVNPFFDRASEMEGLGRPSGRPTVFDVRQSRAADAAQKAPTAEAAPTKEVSGFIEKLNQTKDKISTDDAVDVGIAASSIGDIKAMYEGWKQWKARLDELKSQAAKDPAKMMEYAVHAQRGQLFREAIEAATNSGSHKVEARATPREKALPEPKLDWTKNPEVEAWLRENGKQFKIELPERTSAEPRQGTSPQAVGEQTSKPAEAPAMDVESVVALDPASGTPISNVRAFLEKADARLAQVQEQIRKGFYKGDTAMGVPAAILDTALEAARLSLKAGKSVTEAIEAAIKHIKFNVKEFNEAEVRKMFEREIGQSPVEKREVRNQVGQSGQAAQGGAAPQNISGGPEAMRKSAERATTSEQVPQPVQERIATAPESFYETQRVKPKSEPDGRSVEEVVGAMPDAELAAIPKESNFHVASQLELARRLFAAGKLEEGYNVFRNVSKLGTDFGQNINQFKMLKGVRAADIIHIVNGGLREAGRDPLTKTQMEGLARVADESIKANDALKNAKSEWQRDPTEANAKKAQDALDRANEADLNTQREMNRFKVKTWPQMLKTFAQGNPLTPISHVSNFVGNTVGAVMEGSSRGVAGIVDSIRSFVTSNPKLISATPKAIAASTKGFARGGKEVPSILMKGTGDVIKGEQRAGLQPLRALAKAFAKNPDVPTVGGKVPLNERIRLAVEGTFGVAPETMLRLLSAADRPAYEAARARLIEEQARLKNVPANQRAMAQKFPELFFDKETLRQIKEESADAIFQRPSKAVANLQRLIREKGGDWADLAFTLLVSPYKLTPWNLVVRTLQYNPLIAAAKAGLEASKGNTRAAEISAGRMVVGSMLYAAGYYLYQNGLIGPSLEGRGESQKARVLSGEVLPPNHVNISGLNRALTGGDPAFKPGDETIDLTRGGGAAGAILSSVANVGRKMERKPEAEGGEFAASLVRDGVLEQANFTINQSFLKGVTGLLDAIQNGNLGPYVTGVENMLLNVGVPNTLSAMSRATREYAPDMKSDSVAQEFGNVVRNRFGVLGADDYMTTKRGLFGEPIPQTPEGRNALLYHLFDISKGKQVTDDPAKLEIYRLWRKTADTAVIPSLPERDLTIDRKTYPLPNDLYERYAEMVGTRRKEIIDEMVQNPSFLEAPDEVKIKWLDRAYRDGMSYAKARFIDEYGAQLEPLKPRAGFK